MPVSQTQLIQPEIKRKWIEVILRIALEIRTLVSGQAQGRLSTANLQRPREDWNYLGRKVGRVIQPRHRLYRALGHLASGLRQDVLERSRPEFVHHFFFALISPPGFAGD